MVETTGGDAEARRYLVRALEQLLRTLGLRGEPFFPTLGPEVLDQVRLLGDQCISAEVDFSYARGFLGAFGDAASTQPLLLNAQATFRDLGDLWFLAQVRNDLGMIALLVEDNWEAGRCFDEALVAALALKDQALEAMACNNLGEGARLAGDDSEAAAQYERSERLYREMGSHVEVPRLLQNRGYLALHTGDSERARVRFAESLALFRAVGQRRGMTEAIVGLAAVAAQVGTSAGALDAARLWAWADAAHAAGGTRPWPVDQAERSHYERVARAAADPEAFDDAARVGAGWSLEDAVSEALRTEPRR